MTGVRLKVSKPSVLILALKGCQKYIPENTIVMWHPRDGEEGSCGGGGSIRRDAARAGMSLRRIVLGTCESN